MPWSTVVLIGIGVFAALFVLRLIVGLFMARAARRHMEQMDRDFEERRRDMFGGRR